MDDRLLEYQISTVTRMCDLERYHIDTDSGKRIITRVGFLNEIAGAGKTREMVAVIQNSTPLYRPYMLYSGDIRVFREFPVIDTNIILASSDKIPVWVRELNLFGIDHFIVERANRLPRLHNLYNAKTVPRVIIVKDGYISSKYGGEYIFRQVAKIIGVQVQRVIIDRSIALWKNNITIIPANFTWILGIKPHYTSLRRGDINLDNFLDCGHIKYEDILNCMPKEAENYINIFCSADFVRRCAQIPPIYYYAYGSPTRAFAKSGLSVREILEILPDVQRVRENLRQKCPILRSKFKGNILILLCCGLCLSEESADMLGGKCPQCRIQLKNSVVVGQSDVAALLAGEMGHICVPPVFQHIIDMVGKPINKDFGEICGGAANNLAPLYLRKFIFCGTSESLFKFLPASVYNAAGILNGNKNDVRAEINNFNQGYSRHLILYDTEKLSADIPAATDIVFVNCRKKIDSIITARAARIGRKYTLNVHYVDSF